MITNDYIEHQFCEYMIVQKLYTHREIDIKTVCHKMEVTPAEFTQYLKERLDTTFSEMVHEYRIEEAKELWDKSGTAPICEIAHAVGYGNSVAFLLHFARFEYCLPYVWKRRNLINNINLKSVEYEQNRFNLKCSKADRSNPLGCSKKC